MIAEKKLHNGRVLFDDDDSLNSLVSMGAHHVLPCIPLMGIWYYENASSRFKLAKKFTIYGLLLRACYRSEFERVGLFIIESEDQSLLEFLENERRNKSYTLTFI